MADNTHRGRPIHRKTIPRRLSDRCHSHILAVLHRDGSTPCTKRWPSRDDHKVGHANVSTPNLILIVTCRWLCLLLDSLSFGARCVRVPGRRFVCGDDAGSASVLWRQNTGFLGVHEAILQRQGAITLNMKSAAIWPMYLYCGVQHVCQLT